MIDDNDVDILIHIGLSSREARVYLNLAQRKQAAIKALTKDTEVARQDLYRVLAKLQEIGLVQRIISYPVEFRAIPIEAAVPLLLKRRSRENGRLHRKAYDLVRRLKRGTLEKAEENDLYVILIPNMEIMDRVSRVAVEKAQISWDGVTTAESHNYGMIGMTEPFERAIQRGVKFRHVIAKANDGQKVAEIKSVLRKPPFWEIRYLQGTAPVNMVMLDKKEIFISTTNEKMGKTKQSTWLRTNSPSILTIALGYFEGIWNSTTKQATAAAGERLAV